MIHPRPRAESHEPAPEGLPGPFDRVDRAVEELRSALVVARTGGPALARSGAGLISGGVVIVTDDGRGIGRAVSADLRALGYAVIRVRHGVGEGEVEGVNLAAASAVAALVERARGRGHLAAIVHAAPMRAEAPDLFARVPPDDARALALLAQAAADELKGSALRGGSALVVARRKDAVQRGDADRLGRWIEISAKTLSGVRVRGLELDDSGEPEVLAAEVVRAALGTDTPAPAMPAGPIAGRVVATRGESRAILLGSPDRAGWIHLAAALADWLGEAPNVRLADLALTLHRDQPPYPFRVGLVAASGPALADRLRATIAELADPGVAAIADPAGAYWSDPSHPAPPAPRRPTADLWPHRLRGPKGGAGGARRPGEARPDDLIARSGRDWLQHLIAWRFATGTLRADRVATEPGARPLDLSAPPAFDAREASSDDGNPRDHRFIRALDALDDLIVLRRDLLLALLDESSAA